MNTCSEQRLRCVKHGSIGMISNDNHALVKEKSNTWRQLLAKVIHNWRTRSRLKTLNESQLKDIGLSAADVDHEVHKPLWK